MCGGYGNEDSNQDGDVTLSDFFTDITDGGGAGYSGARFGGGTGSSVLDDNNDRYVSEAEYQLGQDAYEANQREGIEGGRFGDAYNNSQNIISRGSNIFGALPRGSIRQEAALGSDGRDISTSGAARFMQGFAGSARDMAMAPVRAYMGAPPNPVGNPEQQARSFDNILNKGSFDFSNLPEAQRRAIVQGTRSLNSRLGRPMAMPAPVSSGEPDPENDLFRDEASSEFGQNVMSGDISLQPYYQVYELGNNRYLLYSGGKSEGSFSGDALRSENIIN